MRNLISQLMDEELLNSLHISETTSEFIERIYHLLMEEILFLKKVSASSFTQDIREEILKEVTEVYRMKTYGYYNLTCFKKSLDRSSG
jgi:hypothetical protein